MKPGSLLAILLFALVAIGHVLRMVFGVAIVVGGTALPMWISAPGVAIPVFIAGLLWREARPARQGAPQ